MEADIYTEMSSLFTEYLAEKKLRRTEERYMILKEVCNFSGHFDISMLSAKLKEDHFLVSKATLYNTMEVLVDSGLVVRHQMNVQSFQYELRVYADTHLHLVCKKCGAVREIRNNTIRASVRNLKISRFTPEFYCLYIYGLCSKCKYKMQRASK